MATTPRAPTRMPWRRQSRWRSTTTRLLAPPSSMWQTTTTCGSQQVHAAGEHHCIETRMQAASRSLKSHCCRNKCRQWAALAMYLPVKPGRCCRVGLSEAEQVVAAALEQQLGLGSRAQQAPQQRSFDSGPKFVEADSSSGSSFDGLGHCRLLNISVCEHTVSASRGGSGFGIVLYNPLASRRTHYVRVPVAGNGSWTVSGASMQIRHAPQSLAMCVAMSSACPAHMLVCCRGSNSCMAPYCAV
jgi:hypothetical protein